MEVQNDCGNESHEDPASEPMAAGGINPFSVQGSDLGTCQASTSQHQTSMACE